MAIPLFAHVAAGSYLIPAAAAISVRSRLNRPMKIFAIFIGYTVLHIGGEFTLGRFGIHNQFLLNIYRLIFLECILFLYMLWTDRQFLKDLFRLAGAAYLLFWCIDVAFTPFPAEFREGLSSISNAVLIVASLMILNAVNKHSHRRVTEHSVFWIAAGIILYSSGTMVVTLMSNTILAMGLEYFNALWHINWGFTILANLFFTKAFLCKNF